MGTGQTGELSAQQPQGTGTGGHPALCPQLCSACRPAQPESRPVLTEGAIFAANPKSASMALPCPASQPSQEVLPHPARSLSVTQQGTGTQPLPGGAGGTKEPVSAAQWRRAQEPRGPGKGTPGPRAGRALAAESFRRSTGTRGDGAEVQPHSKAENCGTGPSPTATRETAARPSAPSVPTLPCGTPKPGPALPAEGPAPTPMPRPRPMTDASPRGLRADPAVAAVASACPQEAVLCTLEPQEGAGPASGFLPVSSRSPRGDGAAGSAARCRCSPQGCSAPDGTQRRLAAALASRRRH